MIDNYFHVIEGFLAVYGLWAVFYLGVIEEVLFFIPTSILFVVAGFFVIDPRLNFFSALFYSLFVVALPAAIGVLVSGLIIYAIVYWGGKKTIKRYGHQVGVAWNDIEKLNVKFGKGHLDEAALLFLRIVPIFPIGIVSIFCGLIRYNRWDFIWITFFGSLLRLWGLSLLGWYLGREYLKYAVKIAAFERYLALGFLIIVLIVLLYHHKYVRQQQSQ